ncbi:UNVERIFIED_ORG: glycerol kinase [Arthrobacter globiformis]|nr:glycerol kinase [Arthrobacter globiformis]
MGNPKVLAIDCGTQSVRCLLIDPETGAHEVVASEKLALKVKGPQQIEIDPLELVASTVRVLRAATARCEEPPLCIGITNMRESAVAWSRETGLPVHDGIMWMSQQSQNIVARWDDEGLAPLIRERTGLTNHTFFFGSKIAWLLNEQPDLAAMAAAGKLAVGTIDSWLLYSLTAGAVHATDVSNASRYQFLNLKSLDWDEDLSTALGIPLAALPEIRGTSAHFGFTDAGLTGVRIPITGMIGDQQASLLGHGCERTGETKATFGTSCVVSANLGAAPSTAEGLVTSVAWSAPGTGAVYEMEGSAFHCGYTMSWLSRVLSIPAESGAPPARSELPADHRVYLLPSFTELGAPGWPKGSGAILSGLGMDSGPPDIIRAGIESMAFEAYDLVQAMPDLASTAALSVDGGGAGNNYLCQLLADLAQKTIVRPPSRELTALGAARVALRTLGKDLPAGTAAVGNPDYFYPSGQHLYALDGFRHWKELIIRNLY